MSNEIITTENVLDENTRRYYLDAMGIQCWQSIDAATNTGVVADSISNEDVSWPALEASVQQCSQCPLSTTRKQAIVGRGNNNADVMFVLLSPTESDDAAGMVCSGESNELLSKMLAAINVSIADVYITSLLKCHSAVNHTITSAEIQQCNHHLKQQVQLIQPKIIVVLGELAAQCLLQKPTPIDDLRNVCHQAVTNKQQDKYQFESIPLFISYSPEELLKQAENKRKAWADLQALEKII